MTKIAVTGGSGKAGRAVVRDLLEQGHQVLNVDRVPSAESSSPDSPAPFLLRRPHRLRPDASRRSAAASELPGIEAVVHLAAIPSPVVATPDLTFRTNITSTYTVFSAAARLGLEARRVGLERDDARPAVRHAARLRPGRRGARAAPRVLLRALQGPRRGDGAPVPPLDAASRSSACASRTSWSAHDYERFPGFWDDPQLRKWNLWGYVDESHVAQSVRLRAGGRRRRRRLVHHRRRATPS